MVRGCHICEASEDSDSTEHVAVTPDQDQRIDLGASIASLRDVPIVDTDPSEDGWGIDDDLGASEDEASAKSVIEAVARAITNYGRRCRAEHLPDHDGWASDLRARCAETLNVSDHDVWTNDCMQGDKSYLGREPRRRAVERWCQQHDSQCDTERQERPAPRCNLCRHTFSAQYLAQKFRKHGAQNDD